MKRFATVLTALCLLFSCKSRYGVEKITADEYREAPDTFLCVPDDDSTMREQLYRFADGRERAKADSLKQAEMASYPEFQRDSVNFRKITKIINGGYNGWDDRYKLWLNARRFFKLYVPSNYT